MYLKRDKVTSYNVLSAVYLDFIVFFLRRGAGSTFFTGMTLYN